MERLGAEIEQFDQLCDAVGRRFVAFSFIASVQITEIAYDPQSPPSSTVGFAVDDGQVQQLSLADFRERLGSVLLNAPPPAEPLPDSPSLDDIRAHIGRRYLLLASIFDIQLLALHHGGGEPTTLTVELGGTREEVGVLNLRELLHNAVRSELARARPSAPFSIDFKVIPQAEQANRDGQYDATIDLLAAWPGPLSMFLRTPQGQALGTPERSKIMQALGLLGEAYLQRGQADWAEDILRLGIQFGQELDASGPLFALLGTSRARTGRPGEAIGFLRRAVTLASRGAENPSAPGHAGAGGAAVDADLFRTLAECFVQRGKHVAAMACMDEAARAGASDDDLAALRGQVQAALGDAQAQFRRFVSGGSAPALS